jgi:hypothetical protein
MRKYNVIEIAFNMNTATASAPRVVATGLNADAAAAKVRTLNDSGNDGEIARAYKAEVATA